MERRSIGVMVGRGSRITQRLSGGFKLQTNAPFCWAENLAEPFEW